MTEPYYKGYLDSYEAYLRSSPYVQEVLTRLEQVTQGVQSMLDIGAGTGIFSLSAPASVSVTALEPSEAMRQAIRRHMAECGRTVHIIGDTWEDAFLTQTYDVVLCANAIYAMQPLDTMLMKMIRTARQSLLIVMNGRRERGLYGAMRAELAKAKLTNERPTGHALDDVIRVLDKSSLPYTIDNATWQDVKSFSTQEESLDYLLDRYHITQPNRPQAIDILLPYITQTNSDYQLIDEVTMAFITVKGQEGKGDTP